MIELSPGEIFQAAVIAMVGIFSATISLAYFFSERVKSYEFYEKSKVLDEMKKAGANVGEKNIKEWAQKLGNASEPKECFEQSIKGGVGLTLSLIGCIVAYVWEISFAIIILAPAAVLFGMLFFGNLPKYLTITGEE